jgi:hypothetical protein
MKMSTHNILINREQAELLVDLLEKHDDLGEGCLAEEIRDKFGMVGRSSSDTIDSLRKDLAVLRNEVKKIRKKLFIKRLIF